MDCQVAFSHIKTLAVFHIPADPPQITVVHLQDRWLVSVGKGQLLPNTAVKSDPDSRV